jgi:hypothetical protein
MNIKKTINFKELRDKGINAIDVSNDEVIQLKGKNQIYCVVTQEFLLNLLEENKQSISSLIQGSALNLTPNFGISNQVKKSNISSLLNSNNKETLEDRVLKLEKEIEKIKNEGK